jgi:hypothetical protein
MKRLVFVHLFLFWSVTAFASNQIRIELKDAVDGMTQDNCVKNMGIISGRLDRMEISEYQQETKSISHQDLLNELFSFKITIHGRLREFNQAGVIEESCTVATRHALRSIRTAEDYVNSNFVQTQGSLLSFPNSAFIEENPHVRKSPEFSDFDFKRDLQSGDIILSRGNAFTSAAIANLGEFDTQFSHMSMVYKDKVGNLWTVEAHIEVGSVARPISEHIKDNNYRTMVYRFDDSGLAAQAAEYIFNRVKKATETSGNVLYDFAFDQSNSDALFCSEVVSHAFEHVSEGNVRIPMFPSRLLTRKPEFVKMLGINQEASFIPADIEVDPRFKIISEWRDANRTQENLQKDAILQAMYKWNDELGYQMRQSSSSKSIIYRNVAWPLRRAPYLKKYFVNKLPLNMSRELIGYFGVLESVGEFLWEEIKKLDNVSIETRGYPLSKSEKASILDEVRLEDLKAKRKKLHKMYRPQSLT